MKLRFLLFALMVLGVSACTVIRQNQIGVMRRFGKLVRMDGPGTHTYNPFIARYLLLPISTNKVQVAMDLPSKEGLIIQAKLSFLYRIVPDSAMSILTKLGTNYQESVVTTAFRSTARDVSSQHFAKSMHTTDRLAVESTILREMNDFLGPRGFVVQSVLLESIKLPTGLSDAIEMKLEADQAAQQMDFTLQSERKEAERKAIEAKGIRDAMLIEAEGTRDAMRTEAEGTRDATRIKAEGNRDALRIEAEGAKDAQMLVSPSLNNDMLRYLGIEAARALTESPNTKTIVTDGKNPVLIGK